MVKIENTKVEGISDAFRGMRNPKKSNSKASISADRQLAGKLIKAGPDHSKFLRMIGVWADITAPRYFWTEFDTYKVGTVSNSESTMHTILNRPFESRDFSFYEDEHTPSTLTAFFFVVANLNALREQHQMYMEAGNKEMANSTWRAIIQLLPQSYLQKRTVFLNYQVLRSIYHQRKNHKLKEWQDICEWIESLPEGWMVTA